jgi:uncharacterized membrane protein YphA (DoxX/SURF4 family)
MVQPFFVLAPFALFLLRGVVGLLVFENGVRLAKNLRTPGAPTGAYARVAAVVKTTSGLFLVLGLFTQLAAILFLVHLVVMRVRKDRFFLGDDRRLFWVFIALMLVIISTGGGMWTLDDFWGIILY